MEEKDEEKFSDDPIENLRIENELLRLKLDAQFGENFKMETNADLPPELEHMFLNQELKFEEQLKNKDVTRLQDKLGLEKQPESSTLNDEQISKRLAQIKSRMAEHKLFLDCIYGPYPDREMYDFITGEFFDVEIPVTNFYEGLEGLQFTALDESDTEENSGDILNQSEEDFADEEDVRNEEEKSFDEEVQGQLQHSNGWHFIYEEFRPNYKEQMADVCKELLNDFGKLNINSFEQYLAEEVFSETKKAFPKAIILNKLQQFFDSFTKLESFEYKIFDINVEKREDNLIGHCMGALTFKAILENGEHLIFDQSYGFYMDHSDDSWQVFALVIPGFSE